MRKLLPIALTLLTLPTFPTSTQSQPALGAAACAIPGVGWVSCTVIGAAGAGVMLVVLANGRQIKLPRHLINLTDGMEMHRQPVPQPAPRPMRIEDPGNVPGSLETHAAASEEGCRRMAERFRRAGRNIKLVKVRRVRNAARDGGVMQYLCIFEGYDAVSGYYNDSNYR